MSLVIALYNQVEYTKRCLESIMRNTIEPYELILVDNGSTDGTREFLETTKAIVIRNETNLGCAGAWNQGVCASSGQVIGIVNNDILVTPGWLEGLVEFMQSGRHGIVSPSAREGALNYDLNRYAAYFTRRCKNAVRRFDIYSACMVIRRDVFERIGMFDDAFTYGGCEDVDFIWRAKGVGFTIGMTGSVLIHHFGMVTQDAIKASETRSYPKANLAHFQAKWGRTVRGNWIERRWIGARNKLVSMYEKLRYGHTLVEKGAPPAMFRI